LHHLVKTKTPKLVIMELPPMTDMQRVRLFRMMESHVEGLAREDFVPSPGFQCAGCEFFDNCRSWC
jgi:putative RecB family exonuclease